MKELPKRKNIRLDGADYNNEGTFFLTICTMKRSCVLSQIVGTGVPDGPLVQLSEYGKTADKYIRQLNDFYKNISIESYVIMPNHIHILMHINNISISSCAKDKPIQPCGPSRTPVPTLIQNSVVSRFVSTFKRFCNKEYGKNIWQPRSYDHIIRNSKDLEEHLRYINDNPLRWQCDELYSDK